MKMTCKCLLTSTTSIAPLVKYLMHNIDLFGSKRFLILSISDFELYKTNVYCWPESKYPNEIPKGDYNTPSDCYNDCRDAHLFAHCNYQGQKFCICFTKSDPGRTCATTYAGFFKLYRILAWKTGLYFLSHRKPFTLHRHLLCKYQCLKLKITWVIFLKSEVLLIWKIYAMLTPIDQHIWIQKVIANPFCLCSKQENTAKPV